jgi:hypothetical protein
MPAMREHGAREMSERRTRLVDCNPRWVTSRYSGYDDGVVRGVFFDCPEGHEGCSHAIPFTPALDGTASETWQENGAQWQRTGDTFETLTLSPSIRNAPREDTGCALHIFIRDGQIEFCGDSR